MQYVLKTPLSKQDLAPLKAGDTVLLSVWSTLPGDAAHARMMACWTRASRCCFLLRARLSTTSAPRRSALVVPSARQAPRPGPYGRLHAAAAGSGLACMIGKGKRTDAVKQSVVKNGAVYLAAIGGAGALMAGSVQSCEIIAVAGPRL